jgi:hypothetical protein
VRWPGALVGTSYVRASYPSTMLRMVPLPISDGEDHSRHMMLCDSGVHSPVFTPARRSAAPVQLLQV